MKKKKTSKKEKPLVILRLSKEQLDPSLPFLTFIGNFCKLKSNELLIARGAEAGYTIRDYRYHLTHFLNWMAVRKAKKEIREIKTGPKKSPEKLTDGFMQSIKLSDVSKDIISDYLVRATKKGKSKSTVSTWLYTLKSFYKALNGASDGNIPNVVADIKRQAFKYEKAPHLTLKHTQKFMDHLNGIAHDSPIPFRDKVFFLTIAKLGLRMDEALSLRKHDLAFQEGHVVFTIIGKGNKKRTLPLPLYEEGKDNQGKPILVKLESNLRFAGILQEYLESETGLNYFKDAAAGKKKGAVRGKKKKDDYIFLSKRGTKMSHDTARNAFISFLAELRLDNYEYTPHSLRHTAVTNWLYSGVDLETASKLAGHANISITERIYSHTEVKKLSEGLAKGL